MEHNLYPCPDVERGGDNQCPGELLLALAAWAQMPLHYNSCTDVERGMLLALAGTDAAVLSMHYCERGSFNTYLWRLLATGTDVALSPEGLGTSLAQTALHYALMLRASTALVAYHCNIHVHYQMIGGEGGGDCLWQAQIVRGDRLFWHQWSGGTIYSRYGWSGGTIDSMIELTGHG